ncbi:histidine kinase N-terminal 7TM domain-containing protein [Halorientalis marina]|uniref:histidine kinase N-terminal 7TM domain-containing protein n=1 Tax=Halorientalis marina TaxID=2931976 RepID=UPI001FF3441C|nr:histidine kinase N-terminal 7TM domain-containing protein [Halorientalis marina]
MSSTLYPSLVVAGLSVGSGILAVLLIQYLRQYSGRPGANWFIALLAAVALFCTTYGISLVVFDPTLRLALETVTVVSLCFMGPLFLGFGLTYLGRLDLVRSPLFVAALAVPVVNLLVGVTNSWHGLLWRDFRFEPVFGLATVQYTLQPWGWFALVFGLAMTGIGILLLISAILDYGPLYRREAVAVILSIAPPSIGMLIWMFDLGPIPALNLTPMLFLPHLLLDGYAFVGTHIFETNPTTQRAAEQSAIADRTDPQLVVDTEGQIVSLNDRAKEVLGLDSDVMLPVPFVDAAGVTVDTLVDDGEIEIEGASGGVFGVSHTPLTDPAGTDVGSLIALYDITEERRREQRLSVLNRVLRHNLRNEMTVINGYAESIGSTASDPTVTEQATTITNASQRLLRIGDRAREFDRVQDRELTISRVNIESIMSELCEEIRSTQPEAEIKLTIGDSVENFSTD